MSVGAQTITSASLASIKSELRRLYKKYGEDDKIEALNDATGEERWVDETEYS